MSQTTPVSPAAAKRRYVFIVGSPRSGTTWLQLLLAQHPAVATHQETHLFHNYLGPLERAYLGGRDAALVRDVGIHNIVSEQELYEFSRQFALRALDNIAAGNPEAEVVLEKSPDHVRDHELILRVLPEAYFVHLIRDPRDVAISMRSAGRGWGRSWAPSRTHGAAATWAHNVARGLEIAGKSSRYLELRYEDLLADGVARLGGLLAWLGLEADDGFCAAALSACKIENLRDGAAAVRSPWALRKEPEGFYRSGRSGGWRDQLGRRELETIEYLAGPLMDRLGYARALPPRRRRPAALALFNGLAAARDRTIGLLRAI
ncbi:MAG TPA: sulfotransferase [Gammaproteobacteria bacterium]